MNGDLNRQKIRNCYCKDSGNSQNTFGETKCMLDNQPLSSLHLD